MAPLTSTDQMFLQRSRQHLKGLVAVGWLSIGLSVFSAAFVIANRDRLFSELQNIQTSAINQLHAENDRLGSLQAATSLERELVAKLAEKNQRLESLLQLQAASVVLVVAAVFTGGLFAHGIQMLCLAHHNRRYLRIVDALEQDLRLRQ